MVYDVEENSIVDTSALELKALKKQLQDMKEENEILKKALTIFAKK